MRDWVTFRELAAILDCAYFMGIEQKRPIPIQEAKDEFDQKYRTKFNLQSKLHDDDEQNKEIDVHKYFMSEACGHDVGKGIATEDWISKYAGSWREKRESPEANGFLVLEKVITNPSGLHHRPSYELSEKVRDLNCNIFVNRELDNEEDDEHLNSKMKKHDIKIDQLPYIDLSNIVKYKQNRLDSIDDGKIALVNLVAIEGTPMRFVLFGQDKDKAAAEINYRLSKTYDTVKKDCAACKP